jgi:hypothetical protein
MRVQFDASAGGAAMEIIKASLDHVETAVSCLVDAFANNIYRIILH